MKRSTAAVPTWSYSPAARHLALQSKVSRSPHASYASEDGSVRSTESVGLGEA